MNNPDIEITETTAPKKRGRPAKKTAPSNPVLPTVIDYDHKAKSRCAMTGESEKEAGVLFDCGHVKIGPKAIDTLVAQLSQYRREQRGG